MGSARCLKRFVFGVLCLVSTGWPLLAQASAPTSATVSAPPNILFILTDDMGYGDLTCYGKGAGVATPHIDSLASEGLRFTQFYVAAPLCSPSRGGFICGRFPGELRLTTYLQARAGNRQWDQDDYLDPAFPTLPRTLKSGGYATGHFGKWHLGGGRDVTHAPLFQEYGYDEASSTWESPSPDPKLGVHIPPWVDKLEPGQVPRYGRTAYMVDRTLDFIERHKGGPWFVTLWPDDVHTPHTPSPEMQKKHGFDESTSSPEKNFIGVLDEYDRQIGRLMAGLKGLGVDERTIVVFTSDNGPAPPFGRVRTGGLRGMKSTLYEGGIREPFIVRWPGHVVAGQVDTRTVMAGVDLFPSLCAIAGVKLSSEVMSTLDGEDMSGAMLGKPTTRTKRLFWEFGRGFAKERRPARGRERSPTVAVREGNLKLLVNEDGRGRELYDLDADPAEARNLVSVGEYASKADELTSAALEWRRSLPRRSQRP